MSDEDFNDYQQEGEQFQQDGEEYGYENPEASEAAGEEHANMDDEGHDGENFNNQQEVGNEGAGENNSVAKTGSKIGVPGDDDERKIFVGGLHWETTSGDLREYFSKFGTVVDTNLKTDMNTGKSRGFGFVLFEDAATIDKVLVEKCHMLKGRQVDPKRAQAKAMPKVEPVKKIFVGGVSPDLPEADIKEHFSQYGKIEEVELPFDKVKNQRRGFCFITFETEEMVDKAVAYAKQKLGDKEVDVRKATPQQDNAAARGGRGSMVRGGGPMRGGHPSYGYPGYGYPPGYDYSGSSYGYGQPNYGGYGGYGGYDYSGYYSGQSGDWYGNGGYQGYDYSGYYGGQQGAGGAAGANNSSSYKAKRGGAGTGAGAGAGAAAGGAGYHPYSR